VGQATVQKYCNREGFPGGMLGPWDPQACAAWLKENQQPSGDPRAQTKNGKSVAASKARKAFEEARRLKFRNDREEGRLVYRHEPMQNVAAIVLRAKLRLEQMPDEMEMRFPPQTRAENKADFENYITQVLKELSTMPVIADVSVEDAILEAAETIRRRRAEQPGEPNNPESQAMIESDTIPAAVVHQAVEGNVARLAQRLRQLPDRLGVPAEQRGPVNEAVEVLVTDLEAIAADVLAKLASSPREASPDITPAAADKLRTQREENTR
jgi:hypothetical protein